MRYGIILAATLIIASAPGARAQQWCGYVGQPHSIIECGYSTLGACEIAISTGKGAMCYVNPDEALNSRRATPVSTNKSSWQSSMIYNEKLLGSIRVLLLTNSLSS
jgi:Protein of unknown function (DUF3551)